MNNLIAITYLCLETCVNSEIQNFQINIVIFIFKRHSTNDSSIFLTLIGIQAFMGVSLSHRL